MAIGGFEFSMLQISHETSRELYTLRIENNTVS